MLVLLRRTSFCLTTLYGLYFSSSIVTHVTNFHLGRNKENLKISKLSTCYTPFKSWMLTVKWQHKLANKENPTRGRFHKAQAPKFVLLNAKISKAFSMFNFLKAFTLKFSNLTSKNDGVLKVQFLNSNLPLKTPNWATIMQNGQQKCLNWQHVVKKSGACTLYRSYDSRSH